MLLHTTSIFDIDSIAFPFDKNRILFIYEIVCFVTCQTAYKKIIETEE
jgi:hypothetical protein